MRDRAPAGGAPLVGAVPDLPTPAAPPRPPQPSAPPPTQTPSGPASCPGPAPSRRSLTSTVSPLAPCPPRPHAEPLHRAHAGLDDCIRRAEEQQTAGWRSLDGRAHGRGSAVRLPDAVRVAFSPVDCLAGPFTITMAQLQAVSSSPASRCGAALGTPTASLRCPSCSPRARPRPPEGTAKKYVGVPSMNSICKSLCQEDGVMAKFGVTVGKMNWLQDKSSWSLASLDGKDLGDFDYVVATDKNVASQKVTGLTRKPPPLDLSVFPHLSTMFSEEQSSLHPHSPSRSVPTPMQGVFLEPPPQLAAACHFPNKLLPVQIILKERR